MIMKDCSAKKTRKTNKISLKFYCKKFAQNYILGNTLLEDAAFLFIREKR